MDATAPIAETGDLLEADIDAFISRNRDALNGSIEISREEMASGVYSKRSVDDIIDAGIKRHSADT